MNSDKEIVNTIDPQVISRKLVTRRRSIWMTFCTILTFIFPNFLLNFFGYKTPDTRSACREKLTLVIIQLSLCGIFFFVCEGIPRIFCAPGLIYTAQTVATTPYNIVSGAVVDLSKSQSRVGDFARQHPGKDISAAFPRYLYLTRTPGSTEYLDPDIVACVSNYQTADNWLRVRIANDTGFFVQDHQLAGCPGIDDPTRPSSPCFRSNDDINEVLKNIVSDFHVADNDPRVKSLIKADNSFYNAGDFLKPTLIGNNNQINTQNLLFPEDITSLIQNSMGKTNDQSLVKNSEWPKYQKCMSKLFYVGSGMNGVAEGSASCSLWIIPMVIFVIPMCLIILKSILSLRPALGTTRHKCQENCIIMIPCFNETLQELRTSINGVVETYHPDHSKLIMIVCDGATCLPSVLSIVGYQSEEPESKGYQSLGSGNKSLNFAKVYSGFYYHGSHGVPYLIVAKTGNLAERELNGNRGKRDSIMILLNFLDGISAPDNLLTPLEAEIAINIRKLELRIEKFPYLMIVDADTNVDPNSLPSMLGYLEARPKYLAVSGQLQLTGGLNPFLTLISQYHNFVTRHLSMVAANRLSSLTVTNGAFCVFRLHQITGEKCLTHEGTVSRLTYKRTSTLHTKHAVMLGEDVFISTLLLQRWPNAKIGYLPTVSAKTLAPSAFGQIIKKERANISIRFHNLIELWRTSAVMGVSFITKLWTMVELLWIMLMPAFCLYAYWILVRALFLETQQWALAGIIMIVAFALAIFNPLLEFKLNYLVGFFLYLTVGLPFYYFFLPLYTFCTQDDFLWCDVGGDQTRMRSHGTFDNASTDQGRQRFSLSQYEKPPSSDTSYVSFGQDVLPNPNFSSLYTEFKQMGMLSPRSTEPSMLNPFGNQQGNEHLPMTELNKTGTPPFPNQATSRQPNTLPMTQINHNLSNISLDTSSIQPSGILIDDSVPPSNQQIPPLNMNNFPMPPQQVSSPTVLFDKRNNAHNINQTNSPPTKTYPNNPVNNQRQAPRNNQANRISNISYNSPVPFTPSSRFESGQSIDQSNFPKHQTQRSTRGVQTRSLAISEYDSDFSMSANSLANGNRMSMATTGSAQSRRATVAKFHKDDDDDFHQSEELIRDEIRYLLQYADLNTTTRREVKEHLLVVFGENVAYYQDFINKCIEEFTLEKLALSTNTSFSSPSTNLKG